MRHHQEHADERRQQERSVDRDVIDQVGQQQVEREERGREEAVVDGMEILAAEDAQDHPITVRKKSSETGAKTVGGRRAVPG